jgi:hypothetical protein
MREVYARQALNREAEDRCRQIRERAERECGKRLKEMPLNKGGRPPKTGRTDRPVSLDDLGISKDQSSEWQRLAEASDEEFEAALASAPSASAVSGFEI